MRNVIDISGILFLVLLAGCGASGIPGAGISSRTTSFAAAIAAGQSGGVSVGATSGRFTVSANMTSPRAGHTATLLPNGNVLVAGGGQLDIDDLLVPYSDTELISSSGQASVAGGLTASREFHAATLLQNGKVLIAGGNVSASILATRSAELYDPVTDKFTATADMSTPRTGHTASLLADGRVLIFGGTTTASAEIYDPTSGTFSPLPTPLAARQDHTATTLPSGKVLFIGGRTNTATLASAEIFDPATNSFKAVGSMAEQRSHHAATLLPNGRVLVTGGGVATTSGFGDAENTAPQEAIGSPSQTAELFDPQTETFSAAGTMTSARSSHTAALLTDGTVLLCGGSGGYSTFSGYYSDGSVEIYDSATGLFKASGKMNTGKFWHTATVLPNGTVILAAGISSDWALNVVEVFK